jgi:hypothetical protein
MGEGVSFLHEGTTTGHKGLRNFETVPYGCPRNPSKEEASLLRKENPYPLATIAGTQVYPSRTSGKLPETFSYLHDAKGGLYA